MQDNKKIQYTVFEPGKKDMFSEYPELSRVEEFGRLSNKELMFVWWFANRTSPLKLYDENPKYKSLKAYEKSFGDNYDLERKKKYQELDFDSIIKTAIDKMKSFVPSVRMKNKLMIEEIHKNLCSMATLSAEQRVEEMASEEKKAYTVVVKDIMSVIDQVTEKMENAYGVKIKNEKNNQLEIPLMDIVVEQERKN